MTTAPSEAQLRSQLQVRVERAPQALLFGFHAPSGYSGPSELEVAGRAFQVVEVLSPLHFAELAQRSDSGERLICLCPYRAWVLEDVEERLAGGSLHELDPWEAVLGLFRVGALEGGLRRQRELAGWVLESLPPGGYSSPPGPVLTQEFLWTLLLRERLGLDPECHDPVQFLAWAGSNSDSERLKTAPPELMTAASDWLGRRGGPLPALFLRLLERHDSLELVVFGLVCEVVHSAPQSPVALKTLGALELLLDAPGFDNQLGQRWAEATRRLLYTSPEQPTWWPVAIEAARGWLQKLKGLELASESALMPEGLDAALERLADALLAGNEPPAQLLERAHTHFLAESRKATLERVETAVRVMRYLQAVPPAAPVDLTDAVAQYQSHHAWVDRALLDLLANEAHEKLCKAFGSLQNQVLAAREPFDQQFAERLAAWNNSGFSSIGLLPIEELLARVAAPLAEKRRLLVLVLDGCSWPVLQTLLESLRLEGWHHYLPHQEALSRVISGLPSVTEVSRCSLLSGARCIGNASAEKEGFSHHPELLAASRKDEPPRLYHKADLGRDATYTRIAGEETRTIGVVINTIDDTLAREEHLNLHWTTDLLKPLARLLQSAAKSQRLVLLVSDHGHVLEHGTTERPSAGAGNRWQPGDLPEEGTVVLRGGRLQHAETARLAWSHRLRFGPKKRGYHGGASPQEVVCSLALLAPSGTKIEGWHEGQLQPPSWWWAPRSGPEWQPRQVEVDLFEGQPRLPELLVKSAAFDWKRRTAGHPPAGWEPLFDYLVDFPTGVSLARLAAELGLSEPKAFERLMACQRWFRLDGVDVLELQRDRVALEMERVERLYLA